MARKQFTASVFEKKHQQNIGLAKIKLNNIYNSMYKEAALIGVGTGFDDPDREFYLSDFPNAEAKIDALLRGLSAKVESLISDGTDSAWELSYAKNEAMVESLAQYFKMSKEDVNEWSRRSIDALESFRERTVNGMNLSERVWDFVKNDKQQLEYALELGLAQGKSAAALSRDVREYLQNPDKLFRRVRDKDGNLRLSKAAQAYHPGQGVYRSSYKNALRMTITETNMAYRSADNVAWSDMPFVIGQTIKLSNNHTCKGVEGKFFDICDEMQGDYPKEFKFTGWHPHCRCYVIAKLADREELSKFQRMSDEEKANYKFKGTVEDVPIGYKDWMQNNAERIENAKNLPYFIKDNYYGGNVEEGFKWEHAKHAESILEEAEARHNARTPEQIQAIIKAAQERHVLRDDAKVVERYEAYRKERKLERKVAENIIKVAKDYPYVDSAKLSEMLAKNRTADLKAETQRLAKEMSAIKKWEKQVSSLIPDIKKWEAQFSQAEIQGVYDAVEKKIADLKLKYQGDSWLQANSTQEGYLIEKLKWEANEYLGANMNDVQSKYKTWEVSQSAYLKRVSEIEYKLEVDKVNAEIASLSHFNAGSNTNFAKYMKEAKAFMSQGNLAEAKAKLAEANNAKAVLEAKRAKRVGKFKNGESYDGGSPYSAPELAEIQRLQDIMLKDVNAGGFPSSLCDDYANYMLSLSEKYYPKQLSVITQTQHLEGVVAFNKYIAEIPCNPNYTWGSNIGGYYASMAGECKALAAKLNNMTVEELSLVVRFTNGMTFYNAYNLRHTSAFWARVWSNKMAGLTAAQIAEQERIIGEYTKALTMITNKLMRYDGIVYRGVHSEGGAELIQNFENLWSSGAKIWKNNAAASSSTDVAVARQFDSRGNNDLIMIIKNKSGGYIRSVSEYNYEKEVLLIKDKEYLMLKAPYKRDGRVWVELEEI